jgi:hypothetical protein
MFCRLAIAYIHSQMKNTSYILLLLLCTCMQASAQQAFKLTELDPGKLRANIKYEGKVKKAVRWTDKAGDNIVLLTETGPETSPKFKHESDGVDAELFAYHYIVTPDSVRMLWKINDFVSDCPVDIEMSFGMDAFCITDLDNDSVAEIWLLYRRVCHGDISPAEMKIIMYRDRQKYAIRGHEKVFGGSDKDGDHYLGGEYKFDEAFTKGPGVFLAFAHKLWDKNVLKKTLALQGIH